MVHFTVQNEQSMTSATSASLRSSKYRSTFFFRKRGMEYVGRPRTRRPLNYQEVKAFPRCRSDLLSKSSLRVPQYIPFHGLALSQLVERPVWHIVGETYLTTHCPRNDAPMGCQARIAREVGG